MRHFTRHYEELIERFSQWAATEEDVRAAAIIGSRARLNDRPADEWADLDVLIITNTPDRFLAESDWLAQIGTPILTFVETTATGNEKERRVLFDGGLDVDFAIIPRENIQALLLHEIPSAFVLELMNVFGRGMRILADKDGLIEQLNGKIAACPPQSVLPPTKEEFSNHLHDFWYHTVWTAKHLRRGELWWAKSGCDMRLKWLLQRMLEWQARARCGEQHDVWFRGRFLEQWADASAVGELHAVFAHYDEQDIWRALFATMTLFRRLAVETASLLGYAYPQDGDLYATELVEELFCDRQFAGAQ